MAINNIANYPISPKVMQETMRTLPQGENSPKPLTTESAARGDTVFISEQSREFFKVRQLVDQMPEIRTDRVNQLSEKIENGSYHVSGSDLADAVIRRNMIDLRI